jgi:glucose/arabinose dehydrogenase
LPQTGNVAGGGIVSISGTGFTASAAETIVFFGQTPVTGDSKIAVINETTIQVQAPPLSSGTVQVRVATPVGDSNFVTYTYIDGMPISFKTGTILSGAYGVTCIATAPNGDLYIGTQTGTIIKLKLDDNYNIVSNTKSYVIANENSPLFRSILGITFDPMDLEGEAVYVSHSTLFHGQITDFYNGKVSRVSGDLNVVEDVVTGLPVSDLDHGVNGLVFDDNGNLYIQVGANTNAGVPGNLSSSGLQEDGVFSGATLMAHLNRLNFDGDITYDENGNQASGWDVEIFASGERNPFDITLHSNGYLYGTDNGPNYEFGKTSVDCKTEAPDPFEKDELNLLEKGGYYGSANRKRGQTDPRQCKWRSNTSPSDEEYTAPIALLESSTDGIIEFQSDHFFGQLRGNLILGRYKGGLYRAELSSDGRSVLRNPSMFNKNGGLTLTQGPDGTLFVVKNDEGKVIYLSPDESVASLGVDVKSVFPRRGPQEGGSLLTIYGDKLDALGRPTVTVGGKVCPLSGPVSTSKLTCRLPSGTGTVDIVVSSGEQSDTFERGYRYIRGTA